MPNRIAMLASLVIISAVTAITARSGRAEPAGETCLGKPDGSAPEGSYWYSRVDRATHRRCWYVRPNGMKGRHAAPPKPSSIAISGPKLSAAQSRPVEIKVVDEPDAPIEPIEPIHPNAAKAPRAEASEVASITSVDWPDRAQPALAVPFLPAALSNSYAEEVRRADEGDDVPLAWPVLILAETQAAESSSALRADKSSSAFRVDMRHVLPLGLGGFAFAVLFGCVFAAWFVDRRQRLARAAVQAWTRSG
jgi:hypothetical protein